jgi:hypothetical protein
MHWQPLTNLLLSGEGPSHITAIQKPVYCRICKAEKKPVKYASTELSYDSQRDTGSQCNTALLLECRHIFTDDCALPRLNGACFQNEEEWRKKVLTHKDW